MRDLIAQEKFEMAVLEHLHAARILPRMVFTGGTMLRLCHQLDRYSVDLDFWLTGRRSPARLFADLRRVLGARWTIRDAANKRFTMLFELRSADAPRALKLEIRKDAGPFTTEPAIAFSVHGARQVLVTAVGLPDLMRRKAVALLDRREIRDAFDMEHMLKRGVRVDETPERARALLDAIGRFTKTDYTVKLGSLLEPAARKYYVASHFRILAGALQELIATALPGTP